MSNFITEGLAVNVIVAVTPQPFLQSDESPHDPFLIILQSWDNVDFVFLEKYRQIYKCGTVLRGGLYSSKYDSRI